MMRIQLMRRCGAKLFRGSAECREAEDRQQHVAPMMASDSEDVAEAAHVV